MRTTHFTSQKRLSLQTQIILISIALIESVLQLYQLYQLKMLQRHTSMYQLDDNIQKEIKIFANRAFLLDNTELILASKENQQFKISKLLSKASKNTLLKELTRFMIYTVFLLIILSFLSKNPSSSIYSFISKQTNTDKIFLSKQIPGLFPPLSRDWKEIIGKWNITLLNSQTGPQNLRQNNYELEFKLYEKHQNVLYITRGNCQGHIIMNWQTHGNNIYLTDFIPPSESMMIPNLPEDEQCIKQNSQVLNLLKFATVWTVSQENSKVTLFLLTQKGNTQNQIMNHVIMAQKFQKS